jgi:hypothetical protein
MNESLQQPTKAIATVREVCRMVGLSPPRFYQLVKAGVFPPPIYNTETRRPHYTEEQQQVCLDVRKRNCGINGKPVLFYARRQEVGVPKPRKPRAASKDDRHPDILDGVRSLGLTTATAAQVESAIKELFSTGIKDVDRGEVIRAVFLRLKRQDTGDKDRR